MYSSGPRDSRQEAGDGPSLPQLQFHSIYSTLQLHGEFLTEQFMSLGWKRVGHDLATEQQQGTYPFPAIYQLGKVDWPLN